MSRSNRPSTECNFSLDLLALVRRKCNRLSGGRLIRRSFRAEKKQRLTRNLLSNRTRSDAQTGPPRIYRRIRRGISRGTPRINPTATFSPFACFFFFFAGEFSTNEGRDGRGTRQRTPTRDLSVLDRGQKRWPGPIH